MINIFSNSYYCLQSRIQSINNIVFCRYSEYEYDILTLNSPKLLGSRINSVSNSFDKANVGISPSNVVDGKNLSASKFDKKYKSTTHDQDVLKAKKYKSKLTKNRRSSSDDIRDVKILVSNSDDLLNNDSINKSDLKSRKVSSKSKKNKKLKFVESSNDSFKAITKGFDADQQVSTEKTIFLIKPLTVSELSFQLKVPAAEIITYLFLNRSISARINDLLDLDMVRTVSQHYGFSILKTSEKNNISDNLPKQFINSISTIQRPPLITILGHVDHGKTTLLDSILKTNLVNKENGGITQAISGYEITWKMDLKDYRLVFLDTPGHESFKSMRLRGAKVTDIVLLVIAVDDGLKPQTIEVINYISEMNLSCIVVFTKTDKLVGNTDSIKHSLSNYNLVPQEWGGKTPFVEVSARNGQNIDTLLSQICMMSETKKLLANSEDLASGMIIESYLDKKRGPIANVVVQNGTLKLGNAIISDHLIGKVKSLTNTSNDKINSSGPSSVVQVLGFTVVPQAGSFFRAFNTEVHAKAYIKESCTDYSNNKFNALIKSLNTRITSEININIKKLNLIIKADTQGSLEAILELLCSLSQSKVQINIVSANFGNISNADVELASATDALILAFNVSILSQISQFLKNANINFKIFNVIYDLFDYVKDKMLNLIEPEYDYVLTGSAVVKTVFKMNKGFVAGCLVNEGKLSKNSYIRVCRNGSCEYKGFITSLKHMKNDVDEVSVSTECGLMSDFELWQQSDIIEAYEVVTKRKTL